MMAVTFSYRISIGAAAALCVALGAAAQVPPPMDPLSFNGPDPAKRFAGIGIEQRLNEQVPLDLEFVNEAGETVTLGDYLGDKPAILTLAYYECPMLCTQVLNGLQTFMKAAKFEPGVDYHAINVSIDPRETPQLAAQKKATHLERLARQGGDLGWHFLTGTETNIDRLADTVGFGYVYDESTGQYAHSAAIILLTPTGKVSKYYYGIEYFPRQVELGLVDASEGRIGSLVDKLTLLCYAYDPSTGRYGFYIIGAMRAGSILMVTGLFAFWGLHYWRTRNASTPKSPAVVSGGGEYFG